MTIENEIARIKTNISNAYTACENKGATLPVNKNSSNLADCIETITSGDTPSEIQEGKFNVTVIDYDGTILKQAYLNEGDTFILPSEPQHSKLNFIEWVSPVAIVDNKITVPEQPIVIGAQYNTKSGLTEIDIEITPANNKTVYYRITDEKDWGDGTVNSETSHTYDNYGEYTITTSSTQTISNMFNENENSINFHIKNIRFANVESLTSNCLAGCSTLNKVSLNQEIKSVGDIFYQNSNIEGIVFPTQCQTTNLACYYCQRLKYMAYPSDFFANIPSTNFLTNCTSLNSLYLNPEYNGENTTLDSFFIVSGNIKHIYIPEHFDTLETLNSGSSLPLESIDISKHNKVINLQSASSQFSQSNPFVKIYVKPKLAKEYTTATNWAICNQSITFKKFIFNCNITGSGLISAKLNNKNLINGENIITGYDCVSSENNYITIKIDGKPDYIKLFDFSDISDNDIYTFDLNLDSLEKVTLTLNNLSTNNATYSYVVDNIKSDVTTNSITVYKDSQITYNIDCLNETEQYLPITETITITQDTTLDINMIELEAKDWTNPILTKSSDNGTLGGDKFGIYAYYRDSVRSDSWMLSSASYDDISSIQYTSSIWTNYLIIYNPNLLRISNFKVLNYNENRIPTRCEVWGSNDNDNYIKISEPEISTTEIEINTNICYIADMTIDNLYMYKYIKILLPHNDSFSYSSNVFITGQEFILKATE